MHNYKGFQLWICDNAGNNIKFIRTVEMTITSSDSNPTDFSRISLENVVTRFRMWELDYENIASFYLPQISSRGTLLNDYGDELRLLLPGTVTVPYESILEYGGSNYKYKLINPDSGNYAISNTISIDCLTTAGWTIYDSTGQVISSNIRLGLSSSNAGSFGIILNYDGTVPNTGYMYFGNEFTPVSASAYSWYNAGANSVQLNQAIANWFNAIGPIVPPPTDPYSPGGESEPGGGEGTFDDGSDPIDFPSLPSLSAVDTGFITLFNPSAGLLKSLANYMWSNSLFDLDTWKKIFADPMDAILGLTIVPVSVPAGSVSPVSVGNIATGISMPVASTQYIEVDCGTLNVEEYWGAYLDYDPYTKAEIYLPYIGTHSIGVDDIMGKAVHVKYHVDILSGACAAFVKCGDSVLYTFIGQCASSIPITGSDMTNVINGVITAAASIGSMIATGGATAPLAVPALASTAVNGMKPNVEKSGGMSGTGGMLGIQTPYLILTRPRQCLPSAQNSFLGYPSFITTSLADITGYTEVENVHLNGLTCTDEEINEIESLLKAGVIL